MAFTDDFNAAMYRFLTTDPAAQFNADRVAGVRVSLAKPVAGNVLSYSATADRYEPGGAVTGGAGTFSSMIVSGADNAYLDRVAGATGRLAVMGYRDATYGVYAVSVNTAENTYLPLSLDGSPVRLMVSGSVVGALTAAGLAVTGDITTSSTTLHKTSAALTNGAGAGAGTLLNAPAAGNPTKWIPINDNGTVRYLPAW